MAQPGHHPNDPEGPGGWWWDLREDGTSGRLTRQEAQHRHHAPVVVPGVGQAESDVDHGDVLDGGRLADGQATRDRGVVGAGSGQGDDVPLAPPWHDPGCGDPGWTGLNR